MIGNRIVSPIQHFLKLESAGGMLLAGAAALAIVLANTPLHVFYIALLDTPVAVQVGALSIAKPLLLWINDGLMAVFFLLIGLEVKRELLEGELSTPSQVILPATAAVGGFVVPALVYILINRGGGDALNGWAVPAATDIAFALGALAALGSRVPLALKVFLSTIAIVDDLMAIVVIAIFYSGDLSTLSLGLAALGIIVLAALNRLGVRRVAAYMLVGLFVWVAVLKSGVHATLAGVLVALAIPLRSDAEGHSPLKHLEHTLHPWIAFAILPVFAFANAGLSFAGMQFSDLWQPLTLGIIAGLFLGKQLGVFGLTWLLVKLGWARLPRGCNWGMTYGAAILTGIGFTMSLFIGSLAFEHGGFDFSSQVRLGVLVGSILSAVAGLIVLKLALARPVTPGPEENLDRA